MRHISKDWGMRSRCSARRPYPRASTSHSHHNTIQWKRSIVVHGGICFRVPLHRVKLNSGAGGACTLSTSWNGVTRPDSLEPSDTFVLATPLSWGSFTNVSMFPGPRYPGPLFLPSSVDLSRAEKKPAKMPDFLVHRQACILLPLTRRCLPLILCRLALTNLDRHCLLSHLSLADRFPGKQPAKTPDCFNRRTSLPPHLPASVFQSHFE